MPDFWSHRLAAETALLHPLKSEQCYKMYMLGAQGPDLFYYINKTNIFAKSSFTLIGNTLHTYGINETFKSMIATAIELNDDITWAYVKGYLTHYIMDVHCHPFICQWGPTSESHKIVEMYLEKCTLEDMSSVAISELDTNSLIIESSLIAVVYDNILSKLPHKLDLTGPSFSEVTSVTKGMAFIQKMLTRRHIERLPFRKTFSKVFHYNLDLILLPQTAPNPSIDYPLYKSAFLKGIDVCKEKLAELENVKQNPHLLERFIKTTFQHDYLGEEIQND